jgi:hypothetical protein
VTIGEERDVAKQIGELANKITYYENWFYRYGKVIENIENATAFHIPCDPFTNGKMAAYENMLNLLPRTPR